jgi:hypothetical protein
MLFEDEDGQEVSVGSATFKKILEPKIGSDRKGMTLVAFNDGTERWVKATPQQILKAVAEI